MVAPATHTFLCSPLPAEKVQALGNKTDDLRQLVYHVPADQTFNAYPILEALIELLREILPMILPIIIDALTQKPQPEQ
jgi:hypothetical protein